MSDWQQIQTAPKDETDILLTNGEDVWLDYWWKAEEIWMYCDQWSEPKIPTHWMKLPEPPSAPLPMAATEEK